LLSKFQHLNSKGQQQVVVLLVLLVMHEDLFELN
jgi:hypothetical protein